MKSYKYETVIKYITDNYINNSQLSDGKIPSEPELAREMKISRYPVNQAYNILVEQGKLTKISGLGSFIRGREPKDYLNKRSSIKRAGLICETGSLVPQIQAGLHDGLLIQGITLTNILTGEGYSEESILARIKELELQCVFVIPRLFFGEEENPAIKFVQKIAGCGVLPIILERPLTGYNGVQVLVDNAGGTSMAVEWMLNENRNEIAYIGKDDYVVGRERYNGYINALRNHGIEPDESLICLDRSDGEFQYHFEDFTEESMERIMTKHPDCKSFIAFSFEIAYRIYLYLKKHGKFSADTKIAGYESLLHFNDEFRKCYICLERPLYKIGKESGLLMADFMDSNEKERYLVKRILPEMHFYRKDSLINSL